MNEIHALIRMSWEVGYDDVELAIADAEREVLEAQESGDVIRAVHAKMRSLDCWILRSNTWLLTGLTDPIDIAKEINDEDLEKRGYVTFSLLMVKRGNHGHRIECLSELLDYFREHVDLEIIADLEKSLGHVYWDRKMPIRAMRYMRSVLEYYEKHGPLEQEAIALGILGIMSASTGDLDAAERLLRRSLERARSACEVIDPMRGVLLALARVMAVRGDRDGARELLEECMACCGRTGDDDRMKAARVSLDNLATGITSSADLFEWEIERRWPETTSQELIARFIGESKKAVENGESREAIVALLRVRAVMICNADDAGLDQVERTIAELYQAGGDYRNAYDFMKRSSDSRARRNAIHVMRMEHDHAGTRRELERRTIEFRISYLAWQDAMAEGMEPNLALSLSETESMNVLYTRFAVKLGEHPSLAWFALHRDLTWNYPTFRETLCTRVPGLTRLETLVAFLLYRRLSEESICRYLNDGLYAIYSSCRQILEKAGEGCEGVGNLVAFVDRIVAEANEAQEAKEAAWKLAGQVNAPEPELVEIDE